MTQAELRDKLDRYFDYNFSSHWQLSENEACNANSVLEGWGHADVILYPDITNQELVRLFLPHWRTFLNARNNARTSSKGRRCRCNNCS